MNSGRKEDYPRFGEDEPKVSAAENKAFLTLSASVQGNGKHAALAHASFAKKTQRSALKQWRDTMGQIDPAPIKHLEARG